MSIKLLHSACALAIAAATSAEAQDFRQGAPQQLPQQQPGVPAAPEAAQPATASAQQVAVKDLKGVVFLSTTADVVASGGTASANGIDVSRLAPLQTEAFARAVRPLLGAPATVADLGRISRAVILAYRAAGRPLVDVALPEQDVTGGVVQFVVAEFKVEDVVVQGNAHFKTGKLRSLIRLKPGDTVRQEALIEDLNLITANPFRRVDVVYRRGDASMTTDVLFQITDRAPFRIYGGYDNGGTVSTRRSRINVGLNWGDAFGADGQLGYQATVSPDFVEGRGGAPLAFQSHSLTYSQPVNREDTVIAFGTYQRVSPALGASIGQVGKNYQVSLRYNHLLSADPAARSALVFGYDFKQSDNNLLFAGTSISSQSTRIHQAIVEAGGSKLWDAGVFAGSLTLTAAPGGIGNRNRDSAFRPFNPPVGSTLQPRSGTPFAKAGYVYVRATAAQTTPLGAGIEARTRVTGQITTANLLPSEQLSVSGTGSVRGYDPNAVLASRGVLASQEFWLPPFALLGKSSKTRDQAQIGVFVEAGQVGNNDRLAAERKWTKTASTGVSATWAIGPNLQARFDYGWQLRALPGTSKGSLGHLAVTLGF